MRRSADETGTRASFMIHRVTPLLALTAGAVAFGLVGEAVAQAPAGAQPTEIGSFKDWKAYAAPVKGGKVCYALATPQQPKPSPRRRRSAPTPPPEGAYFFISNRPHDGVQNEVSVMPGFGLKPNSEVELTVDGATFRLFTRGDGAFMSNNEDQAALVDAMRGARRPMSVEATSARGRKSTQSYSLAGISDSLDKINAECRAAPAPKR
ncbi:hypothetical protein IHQ68_15725 [Chelatococcus sambhunathii]|uniref:Invasion associated locus B (IalB) protein n=1 Tax=Chelatococcus sambhunathii TaxID=363953 RepID=A0ABU1DIW5_9HYPH|nr:hypothetical protein [Chelatococcus sambhunathii]MDR4308070.1 hypothetical protein [Chelatococcus sambhunathii]